MYGPSFPSSAMHP